MSINNDGGPAFPCKVPLRGLGDDDEFVYFEGMALWQHAAIMLRVPESGIEWLDAMILRAKRDELAAKAMQAFGNSRFNEYTNEAIAREAYKIADKMLEAGGAK